MQKRCSPTQPCTEATAGDAMPRLDTTIADGFIQHEWNGRSRGVAIGGEVAEHLFVGNLEALGDRIKDALVGLMQQQPVDVFWASSSAVQQRGQDGWHFPHCDFVDLLAVHLNRFKPTALMAGVSDQVVSFCHLRKL